MADAIIALIEQWKVSETQTEKRVEPQPEELLEKSSVSGRGEEGATASSQRDLRPRREINYRVDRLIKASGKRRYNPYPVSATSAPVEYRRSEGTIKLARKSTPMSMPATVAEEAVATPTLESVMEYAVQKFVPRAQTELEASSMQEILDRLEEENLKETGQESSSSGAVEVSPAEKLALETTIDLEDKAKGVIAAMSEPDVAIEDRRIVLGQTSEILLASQCVLDNENKILNAYGSYSQALMNFYVCYEKSCKGENGEQSKALKDQTNQLLIDNNVPAKLRGVWLSRGNKIRRIFLAANEKTSIFAHYQKWSRLYQLDEPSVSRLLELINEEKQRMEKQRMIEAPPPPPPAASAAVLKSTRAPGFDIDTLAIEQLKSTMSWLNDNTVDGVLAALLPLDKITMIASMGFLNQNVRQKMSFNCEPSGVFGPPLQSAPIIVAPYNVDNNHWVALIIEGYDQTIQNGIPCKVHVFDSYYDQGLSPEQKKIVVDEFVPVTVQLKTNEVDIGPDHFEFVNEKCQKQTNQHDCGVHTIWTLVQFADAKTEYITKWAETVPEFNSSNYRLQLIEQLAELMHQQDSTFEITQWTQ